jgi:hypothetical protein
MLTVVAPVSALSTRTKSSGVSEDCVNISWYPNSSAQTFVNDFNNGTKDKLLVYIDCGVPANGYTTQYTLTTTNSKLKDSQFTYWPALPPGPTTHHTCSLVTLKDISPSVALVGCGSDPMFDIFHK